MKMNMKPSRLVVAMFALAGITSPVLASDFLSDARSAWQSYESGAVKPAKQRQVDDSWGEPEAKSAVKPQSAAVAPVRSSEWNTGAAPTRRSAPTLSQDAAPVVKRPVVAPSQASAGRVQPRTQPVQRAVVEDNDNWFEDDNGAVPAAVTRPDYAQPRRGTAVAPMQVERPVVGCSNPNRALEGLQVLVQRGQEQRAYDGYLNLFASCYGQDLMNIYEQARTQLSPAAFATLMEEPVMASPKLAKVVYYANVQEMYTLNDANQVEAALNIVRSIQNTLLATKDADALVVAGWLEQRAKNYEQSEAYFKRALTVDKVGKPAQSAFEGILLSYLAQGKIDQANSLVSKVKFPVSKGIQAELALAQARSALAKEDGQGALDALAKAEKLGLRLDNSVMATQAWALRLVGRTDEAKAIFSRLYKKDKNNAEYQQGYVESLVDTKDVSGLEEIRQSVTGPARERATSVLGEVYKRQGRRGKAAEMTGQPDEALSSRVNVYAGSRNKSGDTGEEKLTHTYQGAVAGIQVNNNLQVTSEVVAHSLNDGVRTVKGKQGSVGFVYEGDDATVKVNVGKVNLDKPQGGAKANSGSAIGSIGVKVYNDDGFNEVTAFRKPVMDSTRSFAGTATQGPVSKTGFLINGKQGMDSPDTNLTYSLEAGSAGGKNVKSNSYYEANVGYNFESQRKGWSWLSWGPELGMKSYSEDQNQFTNGMGGYFSPLTQTDIGVKGNFLSEEGKKYLVKGTARAGYTNKSLQQESASGVYMEGEVSAGMLLSPYLTVGAGLGIKTSSGYSDNSVWLWASVPFEKRKGLYAEDLTWPSFR